ncbi:MAG TPA: glycoside hydrolase family 97 N-terminal domain-containing protein, partial [Blastocatellia bacterium]
MNRLLKKAMLALAPLMWLAGDAMAQSSYSLSSPDKRIVVKIRTGDRVRYDVLLNGRALMQDSTLSINIDQKTLGLEPKVKDAIERSHDQLLEPAVRQKAATIRENYNELRLVMEGGYAVVFRAYNEGAAYRLETSLPQNEVKVYGEEASFNFTDNYTVYYPQEESLFSHNERQFLPRPLKEIAPAAIAALPAVVDAGGGVKIAVAESDVEDYPGLWLRGGNDNRLSAFFPPYPLKEKLERDRDYKITQAADYIAVTKGARAYPWRLLGVAEKDGDLITNSLVWLLAKPSQL